MAAKPNIIPDKASCHFYIRAENAADLEVAFYLLFGLFLVVSSGSVGGALILPRSSRVRC